MSGLFPALLLADQNGRPLRPSLLYSDNRAEKERLSLREKFGLDLSGDAVTPKLAWLSRYEPDVFRQARYLFSAHSYIVFRLCGAYCLDYKVADAFGGLLDPEVLAWRPEVVEWAGWETEKMPQLCSPAEVAGVVNPEAAQLTGLPAGAAVLAGSGDSLLAILGAGVTERGEALVSFGTTGWMGVLPEDLQTFFKNPRLIQFGAPYLLRGYLLSLGSSLRWVQQQFALDGETGSQLTFDRWNREAEKVFPGADGVLFLPYLQGRRQGETAEPDTGAICGLQLSHTPAYIYRALLESFGYVLRSALEGLQRKGLAVSRLVCTGSGASSLLWRQIVSDITGLPCHYAPNADPCLGSAFLTALALKREQALSGILAWLPEAEVSIPCREVSVAYEANYHRFRAYCSALAMVEQDLISSQEIL